MSAATPPSRQPRSPKTRSSDFTSCSALGLPGSASHAAKARSSSSVSPDGSNDAAYPSPVASATRAMSPSPRTHVWSAASPVSPVARAASQPASSPGSSSRPRTGSGLAAPLCGAGGRPPPGSAAKSRCRRLALRNSSSSSRDVNADMSYGRRRRSPISTGRSRSRTSSVSRRFSRTASSAARSFSPALPLTSSARSSRASREPNSRTHFAAVFSPMPGMLGRLSDGSPRSAA